MQNDFINTVCEINATSLRWVHGVQPTSLREGGAHGFCLSLFNRVLAVFSSGYVPDGG